jgi:hypothetical protein
MKNGVFWDVTPCGACKNVVPSSPILVTLMKEALSSSETSVLTRATRRNIPEDTILHSHRRENLKSYDMETFLSNAYKFAPLTTCTLSNDMAERLADI